jgi:lipoprotein Spr
MRSLLFVFICLTATLQGQSDSSLRLSKPYTWFAKQGLCMDSCSAPALYFSAYDWLGTPYHYGQALKKKGTDCSGFVCAVYKEVSCQELARSSSGLWMQCKPIPEKDLKEGDLLFFKIHKGLISHVGIYLGNHKFIHAAVLGGVIVSDLEEPYYKHYFYMGGRLLCSEPDSGN